MNLSADEVVLSNGKKYEGRILEQNNWLVSLQTYRDGVMTWQRMDIRKANKKKSKFDNYDEKAKKCDKKAVDHLKLAKWCLGEGLPEQAELEWEKVIEIDKDNEEARKNLGYTKNDGKWELKLKDGLIELNIKAVYEKDASQEFLEDFARRVEEASKTIWYATEGQMYVKEITVSDKTEPADKGEIVIMNLKRKSFGDDPMVPARTDVGGFRRMEVGGKVHTYVLAHELFHLKLHLLDEYDHMTGIPY